MIIVIGHKDKIPFDATVINTTSHSENWSKSLSPFVLGPIKLYKTYIAQNVENGWQYSKVYQCHVDENNEPTEEYFKWAKQGWDNYRAVRYPMGKNAVPLFSFWDGKKITYVEARKEIYIPLYSRAVIKSEGYKILKDMDYINEDIYLWDFDGYNHRKLNMTYEDVINCKEKKMGHAFVIAMLLEGVLV